MEAEKDHYDDVEVVEEEDENVIQCIP